MLSRQRLDQLADDVLGIRQFLGGRHIRHRQLVVEAGLRLVERAAHREDRPAVLDRLDAARGEAAAVADALDIVNDGPRGIAGQQEIAVQRVHRAAGIYGARRCHQRLPQHLAAEDALPAFVAAGAAEQVVLQRFEVEGGEEGVQRSLRRGIVGGHGSSRDGGRQAGGWHRLGLARHSRHWNLTQMTGRDMPQEAARFDVAISGASFAGLALACALSDALGPSSGSR